MLDFHVEDFQYPCLLSKLDERQKAVMQYCYQQFYANYADGVDYQLFCSGVLLTKESESYLYQEFTPNTVRYQKGSRPELEAFVKQCTKDCKTEEESALSLMRAIRDLYKKFDGQLLFYGGTEEELLHKGEQLCECVSRLMVALCEIKGLPGRIIGHIGGGHFTTEIKINGSFAYIDPRAGLYFRKQDGMLASLADLINNRSLLYSQSEEIRKDVSARWTYEQRIKSMERFTHPREINWMENYSLADSEKYTYPWLTNKELYRNGINEANYHYAKAICENFDVEDTVSEPRISIELIEKVTKRYQIFILQENCCVFPCDFDVFIDGAMYASSRGMVAPHMTHTYLNGIEGFVLDVCDFSKGKHTIKVVTKGNAPLIAVRDFINRGMVYESTNL